MIYSLDMGTVDKFLKGEEVTKHYKKFTDENRNELENYLATLLRSIALEYLLEILSIVLNELLVNAYKANSKRVFFQIEHKDINDPNVHENILPLFRRVFGESDIDLNNAIDNSSFKISLSIQNMEDRLTFQVSNNTPILPLERERIDSRIESSKVLRNLSEAYKANLDTNESSGLGIVLVKLLLKNSGIIDNNFKVESVNGDTNAYFEIPKVILPKDTKSKIQNLIDKKIQSLLEFPDLYIKVIEELNHPQSNIKSISNLIEQDSKLSEEIIQFSNSALYLTRDKISDLNDAIIRIGIQELVNILFVIGSKESLQNQNSKLQSIWEHSLKTGFFSKMIIRIKNIQASEKVATIGGLIHDLGRMAIATIDKPILEIINELRSDNLMNQSEFIEDIIMGNGHLEIGIVLGYKWRFPSELIEFLEFHHRPWMYHGAFKIEMETVYIADILSNIKLKPLNYTTLDPLIMNKFGLDSIESMIELEEELSNIFNSFV